MKGEIAIVGAGYVGVPLAQVFADAGRSVVLIEIDHDRVEQLNRGESYVDDVPSEALRKHVEDGRLSATADYDRLRDAEAILVALATPLSAQREPDLTILLGATEQIAPRLQRGQLVVPDSSPEAAELTQLLENIIRSVNIALVNELAQLCDRMDLDVWEIVDAASSKPFGFMRFEPGPGLGGHCLPVEPFYLAWKARQYDFYTEFIELAGKVNANMPYFCRSLISQALNHGRERSLRGSKVLLLGVSYKADVQDTRESPALKLIELLLNAGAEVAYHDPHVRELPKHGLSSVPLEPAEYDCVTIVTAHSAVDYDRVVEQALLVVDFRNATGRNGSANGKDWKLCTRRR